MCFKYIENGHSAKGRLRTTDKRGSSTTQRMLLEREEQINAGEDATGQPAIWSHVYRLMGCPGQSCELGPHCWRDPVGKKHYELTTNNLRSLVHHVEKGDQLNCQWCPRNDPRTIVWPRAATAWKEGRNTLRSNLSLSSYQHHECPPNTVLSDVNCRNSFRQ